jgi:hypothetical protein
LTHAPLQSIWPPEHCAVQLPLLQTAFAPQVVPQVPQFDGSLVVSMQAPSHSF